MEDWNELELDKLDPEKDLVEQITALLQEKLGVSVEQMTTALSEWMVAHAEEMTLDIPNIAPHGQYDKILENNDDMANFLKTEAHKPENWKMFSLGRTKDKPPMLEVIFINTAVDDGETMHGYVFLGLSGKIRHAFAQGE